MPPIEDMPVSEVTNDPSKGGKFTIIMHAGEDRLPYGKLRCPLNKKIGTPWEPKVVGSNPASPTIRVPDEKGI